MSPSTKRERFRWIICIWTFVLLVAVIALQIHLSDRGGEPPRDPARSGAGTPSPMEPRTAFPAARRLVAVGDLHGDLDATRAALRLAGAIDAADRWIGGDLVVVQTGDAVDRGDDDREIVDLLSRLEIEAAEAGGAFRPLIGNHELLNVEGDYRYVSERAMGAFDDLVESRLRRPDVLALPPLLRARAAAFGPGGPIAAILARRNVGIVVGDTAFVHAGLLPQHVAYGLERLNRETRAFVRGERPSLPPAMARPASPVWTRLYSDEEEPSEATCATLAEALRGLGARRMVVGHTVQPQGVNAGCGGRVYRIDTGMSKAYEGGPIQALEIAGDRVTPLALAPVP